MFTWTIVLLSSLLLCAKATNSGWLLLSIHIPLLAAVHITFQSSHGTNAVLSHQRLGGFWSATESALADPVWLWSSLVLEGVLLSVLLYVHSYMFHEVNMLWFCCMLHGFACVMLLFLAVYIIYAVLLLWELLGLLSWCLIQQWISRVLASLGSAKSAVMNRIFDALVLLVVCSVHGSTLSGSALLAAHTAVDSSSVADLTILMMLSVKTVTVGIHSWLPDAMEGPTAVSAMIHAATLVIAGCVWMLRIAPSMWSHGMVAASWGCAVAVYSTIALGCIDAKRIVAYSTAFHVGIMLLLSTVATELSMTHMTNHATMKAMTFMCIGLIIHANAVQDSRSITVNSNHCWVAPITAWLLYHSSGWINSIVLVTKKALCDSTWATSTMYASHIATASIILGVCSSIAYSVFLLSILLHSRRATASEQLTSITEMLHGIVLCVVLCLVTCYESLLHMHYAKLYAYDALMHTVCYVSWWYVLQLALASVIMYISLASSFILLADSFVFWVSYDASLFRAVATGVATFRAFCFYLFDVWVASAEGVLLLGWATTSKSMIWGGIVLLILLVV
uniref:NADH dehydrogenase subunit 5 n=1 Tax=Diplonema sp. ATCC 50224 TaxID=91375 RepID=A0A2D2AJU8_9EUGL|nr:NADH dehydrogenase subunit 5 [Diplonema sp. ATCC 50224]